jgi:hypothetical protein
MWLTFWLPRNSDRKQHTGWVNSLPDMFSNILSVVPPRCLKMLRGGASKRLKMYIESWPNTTSVWAGWRGFDIPVDRSGGVHSLLLCPSCTLGLLPVTRCKIRCETEQNGSERTHNTPFGPSRRGFY